MLIFSNDIRPLMIWMAMVVVMLLCSCKDKVSEEIRAKKQTYIEVARERSKMELVHPDTPDSISSAIWAAKAKADRDLKDLDVKRIWIEHNAVHPFYMANIMVFEKGDYLVVYDFEKEARPITAFIPAFTSPEKMDERLYLAPKKNSY
jgi:hypothetical protein